MLANNSVKTEKVGTFYNWPTGGVTPVGSEFHTTTTWRRMPINQENRRKHGKFPPGGNWFAWEAEDYHEFREPRVVRRPSFGRAYDGRGTNSWSHSTHWNRMKAGYSVSQIAAIQAEEEMWGAEGWRRARPAQPDFSLAQSLYEIKDIPRLLKSSVYHLIRRITRVRTWLKFDWTRKRFFDSRKKSYLRRTSEWHLAIQFGWLPILSDIIKFRETLIKRDKLLKDLLKYEGRPLKRRRTLGEGDVIPPWHYESTTTTPYNSIVKPTFVTQCYSSGGTKTEQDRTIKYKREFVAQFRYWLPKGPRDLGYFKKLSGRLFGLRVTPSMVWAIMPWSWLVDYFVDVRSVVDFVSPGVEDCLICDWCYITRSETENVSCTSYVNVNVMPSGSARLEAKRVYKFSYKARFHGTYFGFRVKEDDLNWRQKSILAALGGKMF